MLLEQGSPSMEVASENERLQLRRELRKALIDLSQRGLKLAAKWAGEMLSGLDLPPAATEAPVDGDPQTCFTDLYLTAKVYFDLGEYQRAAHTLEAKVSTAMQAMRRGAAAGEGGNAGLNQEELFLRCYALYLAGEKSKEERVLESSDAMDRCQVVNQHLKKLSRELGELYSRGVLDGFNLWVYGVVLRDLLPTPTPPAAAQAHQRPSAWVVLLESVLAYPLNWSAWLDLADVCLNKTPLPQDHDPLATVMDKASSVWVWRVWECHVALQQHQATHAIPTLNQLATLLPKSPYITGQLALAYYNLRDFDHAQKHFQDLQTLHPYRLDNLERYSDILYVKEHKGLLSSLAHSAARTDKYRPETCCIIGNYYTLKGQHERAVLYFQRALKLNPNFLFAWTLMGHGYVELRNTGAAIEAYRKAVDKDSRDHNAWYGLGQTYELLHMYFHALYYYRKAATLRPFDARMWCALGVCYEHLDRREEAVKCYERAMDNRDREGVATSRLARLYREDGEDDKAALCYHKHLEARGRQQGDCSESAEALLFLAHHRKQGGDYEGAAQYCNTLLELPHPGREQEEAKALLREIKSLHTQGASSRPAAAAVVRGPPSSSSSSLPLRTPPPHATRRPRQSGGGSGSGLGLGSARRVSGSSSSLGGEDMAIEEEEEQQQQPAQQPPTPAAPGREGRRRGER